MKTVGKLTGERWWDTALLGGVHGQGPDGSKRPVPTSPDEALPIWRIDLAEKTR